MALVPFDSRVSVFKITTSTGGLKNISEFITAIDGLPGPRNLSDVTALGDTGRKRHPSLEDVTIRLQGIGDRTAVSGPDYILGRLRTHTAAVAFDYGPFGASTTGDIKYSGLCWVSDYRHRTQVGDNVKFEAELPVHGAVTRGAYA